MICCLSHHKPLELDEKIVVAFYSPGSGENEELDLASSTNSVKGPFHVLV
jgi:hypothetical protein